jgi:hypothetical protein
VHAPASFCLYNTQHTDVSEVASPAVLCITCLRSYSWNVWMYAQFMADNFRTYLTPKQSTNLWSNGGSNKMKNSFHNIYLVSNGNSWVGIVKLSLCVCLTVLVFLELLTFKGIIKSYGFIRLSLISVNFILFERDFWVSVSDQWPCALLNELC